MVELLLFSEGFLVMRLAPVAHSRQNFKNLKVEMAGWLSGTLHSALCFGELYWQSDTPNPQTWE